MIKRLQFILLFVTLNFTYAQNTIGTTNIAEGVYEGFTLFTAATETYLINNCGQIINQWSSTFPPGNAVHLLNDGSILRAGRTESEDITFGGQGGVIEIFDWEGNLTWQYFYDTPIMRQHHDVFPMPNGNVLILAVTKLSISEALNMGRNPELLDESYLYNEQIIEVTPHNFSDATIVWEWNIKDHIIQDFNVSKDNFGSVSLNPGKLDINFVNETATSGNWLHFNSIYYNSILDQIIISSRNLSEVYIIDHSTTIAESASNTGGLYGKGGDFLYRWGNPQSYKQGNSADRKLFGQHHPYFIEPGLNDENKIMLFNNGNGRTPTFSEIFILNPETESPGVYTYEAGSSYSPTNPDYIYSSPVASEFFSAILSSAQRLPNGNTLICEGSNGRFFEITEEEAIVWEYINPVNTANGTIASQGTAGSSFPNVNFRAQKYNIDHPVFIEKNIIPGDPIELNPNLTACQNLSVLDHNTLNFTLYPNPTKGSITIKSETKIDSVEVFNILGENIYTSTSSSLNLSEQADGLYYLKIYTGDIFINKKVIKSNN